MKKLIMSFMFVLGFCAIAKSAQPNTVYTNLATVITPHQVTVSSITPTEVMVSTTLASKTNTYGNVVSWFAVKLQNINAKTFVYKWVDENYDESVVPSLTCSDGSGTILAAGAATVPAETIEYFINKKLYMLYCDSDTETATINITQYGR